MANRISIVVAAGDLKIVNKAIKDLEAVLGEYTVTLSLHDRKHMVSVSDNKAPFVDKVLECLKTNPDFAPHYLQAGEMQKDMQARKDFRPVLRQLLLV